MGAKSLTLLAGLCLVLSESLTLARPSEKVLRRVKRKCPWDSDSSSTTDTLLPMMMMMMSQQNQNSYAPPQQQPQQQPPIIILGTGANQRDQSGYISQGGLLPPRLQIKKALRKLRKSADRPLGLGEPCVTGLDDQHCPQNSECRSVGGKEQCACRAPFHQAAGQCVSARG